MTIELWSALGSLGCALLLMPLVFRGRNLDQIVSNNPQRVHQEPTSRLGGGVIFLAYCTGVAMAVSGGGMPFRVTTLLLLSAVPVLVGGLFEDVTRQLSPAQRLMVAVGSAVLAWYFVPGTVTRIDLPYVDSLLRISVVGLVITCFMVAGTCNAINLVDGTHGLAGGTTLLMFAGLAAAAAHVGDRFVFAQAIVMTAALTGFLCWNFPRGKVFMGDGGAYFVGFMYAQLAMQIVARNAQISAWFVITLAAYPIVETLYSIYRRKIQLRTPSMQPDALHLHSLIYDRVMLPKEQNLENGDAERANARVAPRLWLHGLVCMTFALFFYDNTWMLIAGLVAYALGYHAHYRALTRIRIDNATPTLTRFRQQRDAN